jgi:hypothetical protein
VLEKRGRKKVVAASRCGSRFNGGPAESRGRWGPAGSASHRLGDAPERAGIQLVNAGRRGVPPTVKDGVLRFSTKRIGYFVPAMQRPQHTQ